MSYSSYGNNYVKYGYIEKSDIDQGSRPIINLPNPINPQDAVPKSYVDALLSPSTSYPQIDFVLNNTTRTQFISDLIGIKTILIFPITDPNGPMAIFNVVKNNSTISGNINRQVSTAGITTLEKLELNWDPGIGIQCNKTDIQYDGTYRAIVLETLTPITLTTVNFVLSGTSSTIIDGDLTGIKSYLISTSIPNGPFAKFVAAKNNNTIIGNISKEVSADGIGTGTTLESDWPISSGLRINKTTNDYNGTYTATFIYS